MSVDAMIAGILKDEPEEVIHIHDAKTGLKACIVIDDSRLGPAIGGLRMAPGANYDECKRLARAMTLKTAAAGVDYGGAKAVIDADPAFLLRENRIAMLRQFGKALRDVDNYIPGPDMGTDEKDMGLLYQVAGKAIGLPRPLGGIPLDDIGATARGLVTAIHTAAKHIGMPLDGARFVVQGFGAVGANTAKLLSHEGAIMTGVADISGARIDRGGLPVADIIRHMADGGNIAEFDSGIASTGDDLLSEPCDIWIPAARPDVITRHNADRLDCRILAEGANIPATEEAESLLHERGILVLPDILANAGGMICGVCEYEGMGEHYALDRITHMLAENTREMLRLMDSQSLRPREAATMMALNKLDAKRILRGVA